MQIKEAIDTMPYILRIYGTLINYQSILKNTEGLQKQQKKRQIEYRLMCIIPHIILYIIPHTMPHIVPHIVPHIIPHIVQHIVPHTQSTYPIYTFVHIQ